MARRSRKPKQLDLSLPGTWGGRRAGAGRKPKGERAGVSHRPRVRVANRNPVHVTIKVASDVPNLRGRRLSRLLFSIFEQAAERNGMRIVHFSIQTNHVHLIVEAKSTEALSRGMQGLLIRLAKRVNRYLGRSGKLFPDRYHAEVLSTPTQVRHALRYVLNNTRKHAGSGRTFRPGWVDPCSTAPHFDGWSSAPEHPPDCGPPMPRAHTWLLRVGWRKRGLIHPDERPGPRHKPKTAS